MEGVLIDMQFQKHARGATLETYGVSNRGLNERDLAPVPEVARKYGLHQAAIMRTLKPRVWHHHVVNGRTARVYYVPSELDADDIAAIKRDALKTRVETLRKKLYSSKMLMSGLESPAAAAIRKRLDEIQAQIEKEERKS